MGMLRHVDIVGVCFDFFACVPLLNLFVCCICLLVCCFGSIAAFIHTYPKGIAAHTHFQTILACGKGSSRARWFDVDSTLLVMVITMRGVIIKTMISYNQGWLQLIMVITTIRMKWSLSLGQWSVAIKLCCAVCNTLLRRKLHLELGTCQTPSCADLHHHHHRYLVQMTGPSCWEKPRQRKRFVDAEFPSAMWTTGVIDQSDLTLLQVTLISDKAHPCLRYMSIVWSIPRLP